MMKELFKFAGIAVGMVVSTLPASADKWSTEKGDVHLGLTYGAAGIVNTDHGLWDGHYYRLDGGFFLNDTVAVYTGASRQHGYDCRKCPVADKTKMDSLMGGLMAYVPLGDTVTAIVGGGMGAYRVRPVSGFTAEGKVGLSYNLEKHSGIPVSVEANVTAQHLGNGRVEGMDATGYIPGFRVSASF